MAKGEDFSHIRIDHIDDSADIRPALNAEALRARMMAAGVEDEYGMQQLLELGLMSQSKAPRHTVLQVNYPAVAKHASQAAEIVTKEANAGMLSAPLGGIPLFPVRLKLVEPIKQPFTGASASKGHTRLTDALWQRPGQMRGTKSFAP
jgi:hypothetical protein